MSDDEAESWRPAKRYGRETQFQQGCPIYHQGQHLQSFFFILDGEVHLRVTHMDGSNSLYDVLGRNGIFGDTSAILAVPTHGGAFAATGSNILVFDLNDFKEAIQIHPDLAWSLARVQASRNYACASRVLHAFRPQPTSRIKEFIVRLADLHGQLVHGSDGHIFIPSTFTQSEIAEMTGLTRVSVSRILKRLCEQGLIQIRDRRILILDRKRLLSIS